MADELKDYLWVHSTVNYNAQLTYEEIIENGTKIANYKAYNNTLRSFYIVSKRDSRGEDFVVKAAPIIRNLSTENYSGSPEIEVYIGGDNSNNYDGVATIFYLNDTTGEIISSQNGGLAFGSKYDENGNSVDNEHSPGYVFSVKSPSRIITRDGMIYDSISYTVKNYNSQSEIVKAFADGNWTGYDKEKIHIPVRWRGLEDTFDIMIN